MVKILTKILRGFGRKMGMYIGALEAGGTKMVCAVGDETGKILNRTVFPTKTPDETMPEMIEYFKQYELQALGIGCFGPIDLNEKSDTYGYITTTPKLAWRNFDIVGAFKETLNIPVGFDTDVNAAALGEATWGITQGLENSMYITIGTGIGAGIMVGGKLVHGMLHPEAGHILLTPYEKDDYEGKCPYHKYCFEGMAAGPAIEERWGAPAITLVDKKEVWEMEAYYIAQALTNYILILSPQRIVLGGGVMHQKQLFPLIREKVIAMLGEYIDTKEIHDMQHYIVSPSLNDDQGIMGAIKLGLEKLS